MSTMASLLLNLPQKAILDSVLLQDAHMTFLENLSFSLRSKTAWVTYHDSLAAAGNKNFTDRNGNVFFPKAPGTAFFFPVSLIVGKNAPIKDTIHKEMPRIIGMGLARHAQDTEVKNSWTQGKTWARWGEGPKQVIDDSVDEKLELEHLRGVFLMLFVSIVFACGLLAKKRSRTAKSIRKTQ